MKNPRSYITIIALMLSILSGAAQEMRDGSYRFIRNSIRPYLGWSTLAFGDVNVETEKFLSYLGYDIDLDNSPEARGAVFYDFLPAYPAKGSVTQDVDMIIVNLGSYPEAAFSSEKDSRNAE